MPWNQISERMMLEGTPAGYIIMPATYDAGISGQFTISVSTDVDFTLEPYEQ